MSTFLYKNVHATHHQLWVPYAYGALYNHPVVRGGFISSSIFPCPSCYRVAWLGVLNSRGALLPLCIRICCRSAFANATLLRRGVACMMKHLRQD